jgi:hypothetical protein
MRWTLPILFLLLLFSHAFGQEIPIGGRSAGLGGAVVAQKGEVGFLPWNPAIASSLRSPSIYISYAGMFRGLEGISVGEAGFGIPFGPAGSGGVVLSWLSGAGYEEGGLITPIAREFGPISLGIGIRGGFWSAKPEGEGRFSGSRWGLDIGTQAKLGPLRFGLSVINARSTSSAGETISPSILAGISSMSGSTVWEVDISSTGDDKVIRFGYEYLISGEGDLRVRAGMEYPFKGNGGYVSIGIGYLSLGWQTIDLAFLYPFEAGGEAIGYRVSVGLRL